ncbi:hypothetical protein A9R01_08320 ['Osedax' symbiont bacterium Rs2_46_30_T18]|nr:hypothetical protein A9R01_08320 ['Osedax' symbiont bacterium Rs2_46_30_T18]
MKQFSFSILQITFLALVTIFSANTSAGTKSQEYSRGYTAALEVTNSQTALRRSRRVKLKHYYICSIVSSVLNFPSKKFRAMAFKLNNIALDRLTVVDIILDKAQAKGAAVATLETAIAVESRFSHLSSMQLRKKIYDQQYERLCLPLVYADDFSRLN